MRRVLITGSRCWRDIDKVFEALEEQYMDYGPFILVHGGCRDGADNFAHQWFIWLDQDDSYGIVEEVHEADWKPHGKNGRTDYGAGLKRNHKMVALGADVCLAFPTICWKKKANCPEGKHYSHGTADCMKAAEAAGIPVQNLGPLLGKQLDSLETG